MAVFPFPVVLERPERPPKKLFSPPEVVASPAFEPTAVLNPPPKVTLCRAESPMATVCCADVVSFPAPYPNEVFLLLNNPLERLLIRKLSGASSKVPTKFSLRFVPVLPESPQALLALIACQLGEAGEPIFIQSWFTS